MSIRLLEAVDAVVNNLQLPENEESVSISLGTMRVLVQSVNANDSDEERVQNLNSSSSGAPHSVFFPEELLSLPSQSNNSIVSLIVHQRQSLFLRRIERNVTVNSDVVSASLQRINVEGLREPVVITLNPKVS